MNNDLYWFDKGIQRCCAGCGKIGYKMPSNPTPEGVPSWTEGWSTIPLGWVTGGHSKPIIKVPEASWPIDAFGEKMRNSVTVCSRHCVKTIFGDKWGGKEGVHIPWVETYESFIGLGQYEI